MKVMRFIFATVAVLSLGAGSLLAQNLTPGYIPPPPPHLASNTFVDVVPSYDPGLEYRISQLEEAMAKKADKVDNTKAFEVRLNGRVFFESVTFGDPHFKYGPTPFTSTPTPSNTIDDILGAREVHVGIAGSGYRIFDYSVELSSIGASPVFRDAFLGIKNVPGLDYVRIGHFKVESGTAYTTSGLNTTAMEIHTASQAFSPGRRVGVGQTYYFANEQVRWFNGIFASGGSDGSSNGLKHINDPKGMIYNTRLTFVPYYAQDGARYLHFGGHYIYRDNPGGRDAASFSHTAGVKIGGFNRARNWFSTTAIDAPRYNQGGFEAILGCGPLAIATELFAGSFGKGRDMYGGYVEVRYFLTGDARLYNKKNGLPGGVRLKKNFLCVEEFIETCHGRAKGFGIQSIGAWELYTQWGFTDSDRVARNSGSVGTDPVYYHSGGRTTDLVVGLNWYMNPTTRMMFEYVHSDGTSQRYSSTNAAKFRATEDIFAMGLRFNF